MAKPLYKKDFPKSKQSEHVSIIKRYDTDKVFNSSQKHQSKKPGQSPYQIPPIWKHGGSMGTVLLLPNAHFSIHLLTDNAQSLESHR
jgi:hypothetical protein